ncbi:MAG: hypothetical protein UW09_C0001G0042 [candidate division TM6 bacterium GW2011_GWF2_43_87]|nr:MAG: hypothetical protein UW09_C0001G0042 [candidate division TM6 bacterium GW2011_GWF2_43_87]
MKRFSKKFTFFAFLAVIMLPLVDEAGLIQDSKLDIEAQDKDGYTPLHVAIMQNSLVRVKFLIENLGANIVARDFKKHIPLHHVPATGNLSLLKYLVDAMKKNKMDINAKGEDGDTTLRYAASCDNLEMFKYLIEAGADLNVKDKVGRTILHVAGVSILGYLYSVKEKKFVEK